MATLGIASSNRQYRINRPEARVSGPLFQQYYQFEKSNLVDVTLDLNERVLTFNVVGKRARYKMSHLPEGQTWYPHFGLFYQGKKKKKNGL